MAEHRTHSWRVVATVTKTHDPATSADDETYTVIEPGEYRSRADAEYAAEHLRWQAPPPDRTIDYDVTSDPVE